LGEQPALKIVGIAATPATITAEFFKKSLRLFVMVCLLLGLSILTENKRHKDTRIDII
jgi:hypothetical protein